MKKWLLIAVGAFVGLILVMVVAAAVGGNLEEPQSEVTLTEVVTPSSEYQERVELAHKVKEHDDKLRNLGEYAVSVEEDGLTMTELLVFCAVVPKFLEDVKAALAFVRESVAKDRDTA